MNEKRSLSDFELAKRLLEPDTDINELLKDEEIVNRLNDPIFQRFVLKLLRARAFASLPLSMIKLIELAESGKESAISMLFRILDVDFKEVATKQIDRAELEKKISELLKQRGY